MADESLSLAMLRRLGSSLGVGQDAPEPTDDAWRLNDATARTAQSQDPWWKQTGRDTVDALANIPKGLLGIDPAQDESTSGYLTNAMTQLGQAADPAVRGPGGVATAVSAFRTKAAREAATALYEARAGGITGNMGMALKTFAQKYPRIAAHLYPSALEGPAQQVIAEGTHLGSVKFPEGQVKTPVPLTVTPEGRATTDLSLEDAFTLAWHEGSHGAQALGNKDVRDLYSAANAITGYQLNPFEINARANASRGSAMRSFPININEHLLDLAESVNPATATSQQRAAAKAIKTILVRRAAHPTGQTTVSPLAGLLHAASQ